MHKQFAIIEGDISRNFQEEFWKRIWREQCASDFTSGLERSEEWRIIRRYLKKSDRILEAGCGPGRWGRFLHEKGYDVRGVEIIPEVVERTHKEYPELAIELGDVRQLPYPDGYFGVYLSLGVIEHFEDGPYEVLREARRVLREGGSLIVSVPYLSPLKRFVISRNKGREGEDGRSPGRQFYQYVLTREELIRTVRKAGFSIRCCLCHGVEAGLQNRVPSLRAVRTRIGAMPPDNIVRRWSRNILRFLLRFLPATVFGHMVMVVGIKQKDLNHV